MGSFKFAIVQLHNYNNEAQLTFLNSCYVHTTADSTYKLFKCSCKKKVMTMAPTIIILYCSLKFHLPYKDQPLLWGSAVIDSPWHHSIWILKAQDKGTADTVQTKGVAFDTSDQQQVQCRNKIQFPYLPQLLSTTN